MLAQQGRHNASHLAVGQITMQALVLTAEQYVDTDEQINPFCFNGLSHTYWYNKYGIVHFVFQEMAGQNFYKMMSFCFWRLFLS